MRVFLFSLLVLLIFCVSACNSYTYDCTDSSLSTTFIGFTQAEIDTLYLRQYEANTAYATLLKTDTAIVNRNLSLHIRHDSIDANAYNSWAIKAGSDWEIFIPAVSRTIRISNIVSEKRQGKKTNTIFSFGPAYCTNFIYSVKVDNRQINFSFDFITLYFQK